jgi:hypothetical protein
LMTASVRRDYSLDELIPVRTSAAALERSSDAVDRNSKPSLPTSHQTQLNCELMGTNSISNI